MSTLKSTSCSDETDNDRFLLCALASKRAHDINDMMRGQRDRAIQLSSAVEIAKANHVKPLSMAFAEIARGEVSFDPRDDRYQRALSVYAHKRTCAPGPRRFEEGLSLAWDALVHPQPNKRREKATPMHFQRITLVHYHELGLSAITVPRSRSALCAIWKCCSRCARA